MYSIYGMIVNIRQLSCMHKISLIYLDRDLVREPEECFGLISIQSSLSLVFVSFLVLRRFCMVFGAQIDVDGEALTNVTESLLSLLLSLSLLRCAASVSWVDDFVLLISFVDFGSAVSAPTLFKQIKCMIY